ncbi:MULTISPECIES: hypothetical protein [unclassified Chamaesiphon]|nr:MULTISPECIES: hypothetical protein [unclassified Chamaesiphon]
MPQTAILRQVGLVDSGDDPRSPKAMEIERAILMTGNIQSSL